LFLNPEEHIVLSVKHIQFIKLLNTRREKKVQLLKEEEDTIENNQVLNTLNIGYGGQTKPIFRKKAKTTKKVSLRLECTVCKKKRVILIGRCKTVILMDVNQIKKKKAGKKDVLFA
jgi:large subunit ribosomal protein L44e